MRITIVAAALLVTQGGCVWRPGATLEPPDRSVPQPGVSGATQQGSGRVGRKAVTAKEEPNRLFAADGSSCIVPEKQFRETELGSNATCIWSKN